MSELQCRCDPSEQRWMDGVCLMCGAKVAMGWSVEEQQEADGSWSIVSTVLPGLVVAGATRTEAWAQWPEVVELWASTANEDRVKCERGVTASDLAVIAKELLRRSGYQV